MSCRKADLVQTKPPRRSSTTTATWTAANRWLHGACRDHQVAMVEVCLGLGANANLRAPESEGGQLPLEEAIAKGNIPIVKALLAAGADVNAREGGSSGPLHLAASIGSGQMVTLLLENGGDPGLDSYTGTPPAWARRFGWEFIAQLIESYKDG